MKIVRLPIADLALTALAPALWGATYVVTSQLLPHGHPIAVAMLRALPAGLILLAATRRLPTGAWWGRVVVLGALNFSLFWVLLVVGATRLPGGLAATIGAVQPLMVMTFAARLAGTSPPKAGLVAGAVGIAGVALLTITPGAQLDAIGVAAMLAGAVSMALGTALTRHWRPPVSSLTFTAWQLTAGGLLLLPLALLLEPPLPIPDGPALAGYAFMTLINAALTYWLWFRGIARVGASAAALLGFMSPLSAILIGVVVMHERFTPWQALGTAIVLLSAWAGQRAVAGKA
jgi:probable blue pigment (indigoidine) exporter